MPRNPAKPLTLEEAYQAAFLWFDHKGEPPEDISEPAHGSIQVTTETTLARVRMGATPADQSSVLALLRADPGDKKLAIFSTTGFTPGAISVAETQGMALYEFDTYGTAHPKTTHARALAPETSPPPPFGEQEAEPEPAWADQRLPGQGAPIPAAPATPTESIDGEPEQDTAPSTSYVIPPPEHLRPQPTPDPAPAIETPMASPPPPISTTPPTFTAPTSTAPTPGATPVSAELSPDLEDDFAECPTCGASHFTNAKFCRSCGTNLITGRPHGHSVTTDGTELVCNTCGSTDIAAVRKGLQG